MQAASKSTVKAMDTIINQPSTTPGPHTTSNAFAVTFCFYHLYQRSRLKKECQLLSKIATKYRVKPAELLNDLNKKYTFPMPESVTYNELQRFIGVYEVPKAFLDLLQLPKAFLDATKSFDPRIDVYNTSFDPDYVLANSQLLAPIMNVPPHDNISKCIHLLPGYVVPKRYIRDNKPTPHVQKVNPDQTTSKNILQRIAEASSTFADNSTGNVVEKDSPLSLLFDCMKQKVRVRIIIRRANGVRGSVDGYIRAFDKHFNLLLTDVDEECIVNKQPMRKAALGRFVCRTNVLRRHLPQVLLRGDNVVLVAKMGIKRR